jgi:hypothetical protein
MGRTSGTVANRGGPRVCKERGGITVLESLSTEELEFIKAIELFKKEKTKIFLSWTEVLKILKELGYQKVVRRASLAKKEPPKRRRRAPKKKPTPTPDASAQTETAAKDAAPAEAGTVPAEAGNVTAESQTVTSTT